MQTICFSLNFILKFVVCLLLFTLATHRTGCCHCEAPINVSLQRDLWSRWKNNWRMAHNASDKSRVGGGHSVKREIDGDGTFRGRPRTRQELWHSNFNIAQYEPKEIATLNVLLLKVADKYLNYCQPFILFDEVSQKESGDTIDELLKHYRLPFVFAKVQPNQTAEGLVIQNSTTHQCRSYIIFLADIFTTRQIIGPQLNDRVVIIPAASQWVTREFLSSPQSRSLVNLLMIGRSYSPDPGKEQPLVLSTHELYTDGLGSSKPRVLTTWIKGRLSRSSVNLFPKKVTRSLASHRLNVAVAHQPPFVIKTTTTDPFGNIRAKWDGLEYRLLEEMSRILNFTINLIEPAVLQNGASEAVVALVRDQVADIGLAGVYDTAERRNGTAFSVAHTFECARFVTLESKSLPRYRAILGPFQLPVWIAITGLYLFAIIPLAFSDRLTLSHLIWNFGELENMFWYVFGTFTNSLTFTGQYSWSSSKKTSTRMLIGWYWVFSIIITACYTGSIIAFVTLPLYPATIDTVQQLFDGFFRIGTFDHGGWNVWFANSTEPETLQIQQQLEFVSTLDEGVQNITGAFIWPYAMLGSENELKHMIQVDFSDESAEQTLHLSDECFARFGVAFVFQPNSMYRILIDRTILKLQQSGIMAKFQHDLHFDIYRSPIGGRLQASPGKFLHIESVDERGLSLADTEGMFLLLGAGFVVAACVLFSEWIGGCRNKCKTVISKRRHSSHQEALAKVPTQYLKFPSQSLPNHRAGVFNRRTQSAVNRFASTIADDSVKRRHSTANSKELLSVAHTIDTSASFENIKRRTGELGQQQKQVEPVVDDDATVAEQKFQDENNVLQLCNCLDYNTVIAYAFARNSDAADDEENFVFCQIGNDVAGKSFGAKVFY